MSRVWDVPVDDSTRVRDVRVAAEEASACAGLGTHRTATAALVATELATNLIRHADGGHMLINLVERAHSGGPRQSVQLVSLDHGPGIPDIAVAMRDGYTTASSLGAGLGTCRRIANDFDLHSAPGRGTVAVARIDHEPPAGRTGTSPRGGPSAGGVNVPLGRAEHSGDAWSHVGDGDRLTLLLADGLGHGAKAAEASDAAVKELRGAAGLPPAEILRHLGRALRPTRGAAVAVAQLDLASGRLHFAGIGNVGARLRTGGTWKPLLSQPGIVGAQAPASVPVQRVPWQDDSLLVLHSDGLPGRWTSPEDTVLLGCDPALMAAVILRDAGSAARPVSDDTCVAVLGGGGPAARRADSTG
ncbi:magnesium or manganese-dependent protein phosphatase [Streptomyces viridochromogenes DSM 40736]|uniref:Magnesium or manganese-dependent protein phosphatase n=1 Tax=Streptomyces viridochromogenes (strain DSM 40736 / JCM 4977 / BCRC 1201 / Tue 494) TaxID=591159 RepID=D9WYR4_STRVT|nr:ATP-binding SpoIIE family protein phosphatase [Streptomyces viridochromogenes]EFL33193.1 magnesium or manganese-dependent protein phosphatase [Streptomyces viridochromogenes DSM 40736]